MRGRWLALAGLLALGCADPKMGDRFRADRDVWLADYEYRNLVVRPDLVSRDQWQALIGVYEEIPPRYAHVQGDTSDVGLQIRRTTAQALFSAVQIQGAIGDTASATVILHTMRDRYADMDAIIAQVALSQGMIEELRGKALEAAAYYSEVVSRANLASPAARAAGMGPDLYLRIARLRALDAPPEDRPAIYAQARAYFDSILEEPEESELTTVARMLLTELSMDLREWESAEQQLRALEDSARTPARDADPASIPPEEFRIRRAEARARSGADPAEVRTILLSILEDYPESPLLTRVYGVLAENAIVRGETDEAIGYLEELRDEETGDEEVVAGAMLSRARLIASVDGRWFEALAAYRELSVEHPISEAALTAPLEIALRYRTTGETEAMEEALVRAERDYRDFIERFPPGGRSILARRKLAATLVLRQDFDGAVTEMERLGEVIGSTEQGAMVLADAARLARAQLADTVRTVGILDRIVAMDAESDVGTWARGEADRLRGGPPQ